MNQNVVARIKAKAGKEKALKELLKGLVEQTHQEPGCLVYTLHEVPTDPVTFFFIEKWASESALQSHLSSAHVGAALKRKEELISEMEIVPLSRIEVGTPSKLF